MSYEYRAQFGHEIPPDLAARVLSDLGNAPEWRVIESSGSALRLSSAARPQRETWPEDVTVFTDGQGLDLVFDSATRAERAAFIEHVRQVLQSHQIESEIEEL